MKDGQQLLICSSCEIVIITRNNISTGFLCINCNGDRCWRAVIVGDTSVKISEVANGLPE